MPAAPLMRPLPLPLAPLPVAPMHPSDPKLVLANPFRPPWIYVLVIMMLAPLTPEMPTNSTKTPPEAGLVLAGGILVAAFLTLWVTLFPGR